MKTIKVYGFFTTEMGCFVNSWLELPENYTTADVIRACQERRFIQFMVGNMTRLADVPQE